MLIKPEGKQVEISWFSQEIEMWQSSRKVSGEEVLPELNLNLEWIWG